MNAPKDILTQNHFEALNLEPTFTQDSEKISANWRTMQKLTHPDKYASQGAAAQRLAMQYSAKINEAYQTLKDPVKRATYICEQNQAPINAENNTAMPAEFLIEQMTWHEKIQDLNTPEQIQKAKEELQTIKQNLLAQIQKQIDQEKNHQGAAQTIRQILFWDKLKTDLDKK